MPGVPGAQDDPSAAHRARARWSAPPPCRSPASTVFEAVCPTQGWGDCQRQWRTSLLTDRAGAARKGSSVTKGHEGVQESRSCLKDSVQRLSARPFGSLVARNVRVLTVPVRGRWWFGDVNGACR
jgi:hypothetical protein